MLDDLEAIENSLKDPDKVVCPVCDGLGKILPPKGYISLTHAACDFCHGARQLSLSALTRFNRGGIEINDPVAWVKLLSVSKSISFQQVLKGTVSITGSNAAGEKISKACQQYGIDFGLRYSLSFGCTFIIGAPLPCRYYVPFNTSFGEFCENCGSKDKGAHLNPPERFNGYT